ncbi:hypothetical protein FRX31_019045, partial [Thalictrum thalictroides]
MLELWTDLLSSDQQILLKLYEANTVVDWFSNWPVNSGNDLMVRVWRGEKDETGDQVSVLSIGAVSWAAGRATGSEILWLTGNGFWQ